MTTRLVLWDIDHTLIENHGVNKETYALAFKLLTRGGRLSTGHAPMAVPSRRSCATC